MSDLKLEVRGTEDRTEVWKHKFGKKAILVCPTSLDDYWAFRVKVSEDQAVVGFPKFGTIGVGFAKETDWNTNLPFQCKTDEIWNHIKHNKGNDAIKDEDCVEAIKLIQKAAKLAMAEAS